MTVQPKLKGPSEEEFLQQVIQLARLRGFRVAHFRAAKTSKGWRTAVSADGEGFPDLIMIRRKNSDRIAAELKVPPNKPTAAQLEWLKDFESVGFQAYLWTPDDWPVIEEVLK